MLSRSIISAANFLKKLTFVLFFILISNTLFSQNNTISNKASSALISSLLEQAEEEKKLFHDEEALECYKKILKINPSNKKALQGIRSLHQSKKEYNKELYHETKARLLSDVNEAWKETNLLTASSYSVTTPIKKPEQIDDERITTKLHTLIIPHLHLENAPISEAVDYLKQKSREQDPLQEGINIFLKLPAIESASSSSTNPLLEPLVSLNLDDVPLSVALDYVARQVNLVVKVDPYAVALLPPSRTNDLLFVKEYDIPPHFFPTKEEISTNTPALLEEHEEKKEPYCQVKEYFQSQGIEFPPEGSANYLPSSGKLIVRSSQENLDVIDSLVLAAKKTPSSQIAIETKFIEVSNDQLNQLGFNWLLGPLQIGNSGIYAKGEGTAASFDANSSQLSINELTSGNCTLDDNPVDSVINNDPQNPNSSTPGVFNISGIYTASQLQLIIKALHQKKGIDVMAAPHVTTKSGLKATVKIVDEFIYPTQYAPPQIPQSTTNGSSLLNQPPPTVVPSFPNAWSTKNLGVILEAKPTIEPDGYSINLELHPQLINFDGFINYGTPINTIGYRALSLTNSSMIPFSSTLTTNSIEQPVFSVREVTTSVMVKDGETIILGGLIREDTQKVEKKIPLLGSIPIAGRLFQSNAERKLKKNLIIFVTPKILRTRAY